MTQDEMYEHIRAQMRGTDVSALEALYNTLTVCGVECKKFFRGENHLYVRCDMMPSQSIETIGFLASSNFLTWRIVAFIRVVDGVGQVATPYINIYK